jgi:sulfoxide reductase heme-binding subunit YedZ
MLRNRVTWLQLLPHAAASAAAFALAAGLAWAFWQGRLGPDPVGELLRRTGRYAVVFLLLSLVPTVAAALGWRALLRVRRALGLYAFAFAVVHLLIFAGLDYAFNLQQIVRAVREGWRVLVGLAALLVLLPLAVTSTNGWRRRLGQNWGRLHRLVYLAAGLDVVHYALNFKELRVAPVLAGVVLVVLLVVRIPPVARLLRWRGEQGPDAAG